MVYFVIPSTGTGQNPTLNKVRIRKIDVSGNDNIDKSDILAVFPLKKGNIKSKDEIISSLDSLNLKLKSIPGFPFAELKDYQLNYAVDSSYINLYIDIYEGPLSLINNIIITGAHGGREEEVIDVLNITEGDLFDVKRIKSSQLKIIDHFRNLGYPFVKVKNIIIPEIKADTSRNNLEFNIMAGQRVRIEEFSFSGNKKTRENLLLRICDLDENSIYNPDSYKIASQRIMNTGWFAAADSGNLYKNNFNQYGILFAVNEQPTSSISGVLGYAPESSTDNNLAGSIDAKLDNIAGTGRRLDFRWQRENESRSAFAVSYAEPFLFNLPLEVGLSLEQETAESLYVSIEFQADATWSFNDFWKINGNVFWKNVSEDTLQIYNNNLDYSLNGFGLGLIRDSRDYPDNPASGIYFYLNSDRLFPSNLEGMKRFNKNSLKFDIHYPLNNKKTRQLYISLNVDEIHSNRGIPPVSEWYRIGGANSIRGYLENSLTIQKYALINSELRFLTGLNSRLYLLSDSAVTQKDDNNKWYNSFGFGLQTSTPLGLINIAAAIPAGEGFSATVIHSGLSAKF